MSPRPIPTPVMHFTHVDDLPTIMREGLVSDSLASSDLLTMEAGNRDIKARRRGRQVEVPPFGVVADYVPFYFAPRSPMIYAVSHGKVPEFDGKVEDLIYLVTDTQTLSNLELAALCTDRNATLTFAEFRPEADCDDLVDWDLMRAKWWYDTPEEPDRRERRMAECLVHRIVPFAAFSQIVVYGAQQAQTARQLLATVGSSTPVSVRPHWYI